MEDSDKILLTRIIFSINGLLLQLIGIYTSKVSNKWNNQVIILMNLSLTEIILITNDIIEISMGMNEYHDKYYSNTNVIDSYYKPYPDVYNEISFHYFSWCSKKR